MSRIAGIDSAAAFVAFAQAHHAGDLIRFEVGDAQQLQFPDRSITRALSLLNLNFIPDPKKALQEMARVTQPGGSVAAAVWDYGQGMEMLRAFWDEAVALNRDGPDAPIALRALRVGCAWHGASITMSGKD